MNKTGIPAIDKLYASQAKLILAKIFKFMYQEADGSWDMDKEMPGTDTVDMLIQEMPDLEGKQIIKKPRIRLIVELYGGVIEKIHQDNPDVEITDVVFLEDKKYLDGDEDRDEKGNLRFPVETGAFKGQGIYIHYVGTGMVSTKNFTAVMRASNARAKFKEKVR